MHWLAILLGVGLILVSLMAFLGETEQARTSLKWRKDWSGFAFATGIGLTGFAVIHFLAGVEQPDIRFGNGVGLGLFALLCLIMGLNLARLHHDRFPLEQKILALAASDQGRLTIAAVAARCKLSLRDSQEMLEHMVRQGAARPELGEDGMVAYVFTGLAEPARKTIAQEEHDT